MLAHRHGVMYTGACVILLYDDSLEQSPSTALDDLVIAAEAMGLRVSVSRIVPSVDPAIAAYGAGDTPTATVEHTPDA